MTHPVLTPQPVDGNLAGRPAAKTYLCPAPVRAHGAISKTRPGTDASAGRDTLVSALADLLAQGATHLRHGRSAQALNAFDRATSLDPADPAAQFNRGVVLRRLGRHVEARKSYERAAALAPLWPEVHHGLGRLHLDLGDAESARACLSRAVELAPESTGARHHLAVAHQRLGRHDEALAEYEHLVANGSSDWQTHNNLAFLLLRRGDFRRGFRELEWRFQAGGATPQRLDRPQPVWHGENLAGRTLLLCEEQGAGDMIQFVRLASKVNDLGGRVLVECGRPLRRLFEWVPGVDGCVDPAADCSDAHFQLPLLSLPRVLGLGLDEVPSRIPYVTAAQDPEMPALAEVLDPTLAPFADRLKIGIVWEGSPDNAVNDVRSCTPEVFAPLAEVPGVELFSLQFAAPDEIELRLDGLPIRSLAPWLGDFAHTAAVLERLDLVLTVDTSMAHLASALGLPTWVMLHAPDPDWRWLEGRDDSPWYPSMRLFRQPSRGDWAGALRSVADAARDLLGARP